MHARLVLVGDAALALALFVLAWVLSDPRGGVTALTVVSVAAPAVAAGLACRRAAWSVGLVWLAAGLQVLASDIVPPAWLALPFVAYRVARHGSRAVLWAAGLSVPVGSALAVLVAVERPQAYGNQFVLSDVIRASGGGAFTVLLALIAVIAAPFALGVVVRISEDYRRAEARAAAEHALAQARATQTQLTRDVHDVVGHSLAVIVAQADSAQLTAQDETVRATLAQIAAVGRSSLAEVRDVLARTREPATDAPPAPAAPLPELDELIEGVRSAGNDVADRVDGSPVVLDDATGAAAYRVLQEMLTNALKHGAPGGPIEVERTWTPDGLTVRVANPVVNRVPATVPGAPATGGMGLPGLRTRVDAVGGTVRAGTAGAPPRFVATAFLPAGRR